jgi:hypothetical protein
MSRFDQGRWNRILVWTGAALAWGSALVAARLEPARGSDLQPATETGQVETINTQPALPRPPAQGLVVLRYTQETHLAQTRPDPASTLATAAVPAPEMVSSGS